MILSFGTVRSGQTVQTLKLSQFIIPFVSFGKIKFFKHLQLLSVLIFRYKILGLFFGKVKCLTCPY